MDSQAKSEASPPSYNSLTSYPTTDTTGSTPYPPLGTQQYPPPAQYRYGHYPPTTGRAPYGQLQAGYPTQPRYGSPQYMGAPLQQEQQQVVVVGAGQPHPVIVHHVPSYVGHIVFSCFVFWCCNWLFGLIAFILASQCTFVYTGILNNNCLYSVTYNISEITYSVDGQLLERGVCVFLPCFTFHFIDE